MTQDNNPGAETAMWLVFSTAHERNYWVCAQDLTLELVEDHIFRAKFTLPILLSPVYSFLVNGSGLRYYNTNTELIHYENDECFYSMLVSRGKQPIYELGLDGIVAYTEG